MSKATQSHKHHICALPTCGDGARSERSRAEQPGRNLCVAGGVAQNSVLCGLLRSDETLGFDEVRKSETRAPASRPSLV